MVRALIFSTISLPIMVLAIVGALFLIKPMPNQPAQTAVKPISRKERRLQIKAHTMDDFLNKRWADVRHTLDSLFTEIDILNDSLRKQALVRDSLEQQLVLLQFNLEQSRKEIEGLQQKLVSAGQQQKRIKDLAKTLSGLKGKSLANIVAKMKDDALIQIYQQMSATAKKNLMAGLPPDRAAAIAQKMLKN